MSVEFEPVRLGRRGRRVDPVALGAIVVAIGLAAAVLKPWAGNPTGDSTAGTHAEASPAPVASTTANGSEATGAIPIPRVILAGASSALSWSEIEPVVHRHDTWGIRAIVVQQLSDSPLGARLRLVERWYPLAADGDTSHPILVDSNDRAILALGLTFPPAHTPLDVRFWRSTSAGLDWVDTRSVDTVPSGGAFLYVRPGLRPGDRPTWAPGEYRIDVLVDGSVGRLRAVIPDRFSNVPGPTDRPTLRSNGPLIEPGMAPLSDLPVGPFATVDGVAVPLSAVEGPALDEAAAWLDLDPGTGRRPRSYVAPTYLPRATGLGVALPARAVVTSAELERLAPEPLAAPAERVDPGAGAGVPTALALFQAPDGTWPPGVYRLSLVWADVEGLHRDSWHVELRPGPVGETAPLLDAARAWARFAGADGVILGTVEPLETGLIDGVIELVPLRPDSAGYPAETGVGCGGTVIETNPGILGFAYPADWYATSVRARILRPFLRRDDQVLLTAAFGVRGLILAAPARIEALPAATYDFTVAGDDAERTYSLCLGMASFDDG